MCNPKNKHPMPDINEQIRGMNLFSPNMTYAFEDKDFTIHTLEALLGMEITEEMKNEMNVIAERSKKNPDGTRGARFDVLVSFPSKRINIEIQKAQNGDETNPAKSSARNGICFSSPPCARRMWIPGLPLGRIPRYRLSRISLFS